MSKIINDSTVTRNAVIIGYKYKKKKIVSKYSKKVHTFLSYLYDRGYLYRFKIIFCLKINYFMTKVFLKYYNNIPVLNEISILNSKKKKSNKTNKKLSKIKNNNDLIVVSNSYGIMCLKDTLLHYEGGTVLFIIN